MHKVTAVEISDCTLEEAAGMLEVALNAFPGTVTLVLPCTATYSRPAGPGSMRDFHYAQSGYLIVGDAQIEA